MAAPLLFGGVVAVAAVGIVCGSYRAIRAIFSLPPQPMNPTIHTISKQIGELEYNLQQEKEKKSKRFHEANREPEQEDQEQEQTKMRAEVDEARRILATELAGVIQGTREANRLLKEALEEERKLAERRKKEVEEQTNYLRQIISQGIKPEFFPTKEQFFAAKDRIQYDTELLHCAVSGASGSGKSSFINAIRGLSRGDPGYARTGTVETTLEVTRYPDHRHNPPRFVWYDIPGAGTTTIPAWQYFNNQGLFMFDIMIVVYSDRFLQIDIDILKGCRTFNIPVLIVRAKSDQHVANIMEEMNHETSGDDEATKLQKAKDEFIEETCSNIKSNLEQQGLLSKPADGCSRLCYMISNRKLHAYVKNDDSANFIDEAVFFEDLQELLVQRRYFQIYYSWIKSKAAQATSGALSMVGLG